MVLISVVVPIYNVEKYLGKCVDSLLNQTYKKIEIILVDDGSTDDCGKICDLYEKQDERIVVLHKTNGGLSDARNAGIDVAKGEFITFVDSDDWVLDSYIGDLYNTMVATGSDIAIVGMLAVRESNQRVLVDESSDSNPIKELSKEEAILETLDIQLRQSACGKLYPKRFFDEVRFPRGAIYEDIGVVFYLLSKCHKVSICSKDDYLYLIRDNSIMTSSFSIIQYHSLAIIEEELDFLSKEYPQYSDKIYARKCYDELFVYYRFRRSKYHKKFAKEYKMLRELINRNISMIGSFKNIKKTLRTRIFSFKMGWLCFSLVTCFSNWIIAKRQLRELRNAQR